LIAVLLACRERPEAAKPPTQDTAPGGGMAMAMPGMEAIPAMRSHLDSLAAMEAGQVPAVMAAHQDLASRTMDAIGADMRMMGMTADSSWTALRDSLQQDLAELSRLSGDALQGRLRAHLARMSRFLTRHETMMRR
jgi:hypothetical protein